MVGLGAWWGGLSSLFSSVCLGGARIGEVSGLPATHLPRAPARLSCSQRVMPFSSHQSLSLLCLALMILSLFPFSVWSVSPPSLISPYSCSLLSFLCHCVCSFSFLLPTSFSTPPPPPHIHWHLPLTSFPLSWSLSSCLVTAFPTSPAETIATGSLEMRPFILLLSFAFPPRQATHVDAPITGTQAGCLCPRPIHRQVDSGSRSCWGCHTKCLCASSGCSLQCSRTAGSPSFCSKAHTPDNDRGRRKGGGGV